jgi:hypothetical protein
MAASWASSPFATYEPLHREDERRHASKYCGIGTADHQTMIGGGKARWRAGSASKKISRGNWAIVISNAKPASPDHH